MLTENQERWLQALESGEYKQTHGAMNIGGDMCPLGVACDVSNLSHWDQESYMGNTGVAPNCVVDWIGFTNRGMGRIIKKNDDQHMSFKEIAKNIRSEPDLYFNDRNEN